MENITWSFTHLKNIPNFLMPMKLSIWDREEELITIISRELSSNYHIRELSTYKYIFLIMWKWRKITVIYELSYTDLYLKYKF